MLHQDAAGAPHARVDTVRAAPVSRAVYGLVSVLAVLQALQIHPPSAWAAAVTLFGTTLAVALLDAYSDSIAETLAHGRRLDRAQAVELLRDVAPVLTGAQGPTVLLVLAALGLFSTETALDLAELVAFVSLFGYGLRIGQLLHEVWWRRLLSGLLLVAIGGIIVGIKAAFH